MSKRNRPSSKNKKTSGTISRPPEDPKLKLKVRSQRTIETGGGNFFEGNLKIVGNDMNEEIVQLLEIVQRFRREGNLQKEFDFLHMLEYIYIKEGSRQGLYDTLKRELELAIGMGDKKIQINTCRSLMHFFGEIIDDSGMAFDYAKQAYELASSENMEQEMKLFINFMNIYKDRLER